jgi:myosin-5
VAAHVVSGDKNDILLLDSVSLDDTPFELPPEREVTAETYLPSFVSIHVLNTRVRKQKY